LYRPSEAEVFCGFVRRPHLAGDFSSKISAAFLLFSPARAAAFPVAEIDTKPMWQF
jgi:hypothetical protein